MKSGMQTKIVNVQRKEISPLAKLLETIEWIKIPVSRIQKLTSDQIAIGFSKYAKSNEEVDKVMIRIGTDVMNKMGWAQGDRIDILYDPDYVFRFLLLKNDHGRKIQLEADSRYGNITFPWKHKTVKLEEMRSTPVKYEVYDKYLSFCADEENYLK